MRSAATVQGSFVIDDAFSVVMQVNAKVAEEVAVAEAEPLAIVQANERTKKATS